MAKGEGKSKAAPKAKGGTAKTKKAKDPNAPKRPKSAYFFFLDDVREEVKTKNPDKTMGEMSKIMGAMWNDIKETKEAEKYLKKAADDKVRYENDKKKYESTKDDAKEEEAEDEDDE